MRGRIGLCTMLLALAACGSDGAAGPPETGAPVAAEMAFPVVAGFAVRDPPRYYAQGRPMAEGEVPEVDVVALVARVDGDRLSDAIVLRAFVGELRFVNAEVTIDGRQIAISGTASLFDNLDVASIRDASSPDVVLEVIGRDPVKYLETGGLDGLGASSSGVVGVPNLDLGTLPEGYTVVIAPTDRQRSVPLVTVRGDHDTWVETTMNDPRIEFAPQLDIERVSIGDRQVWRTERAHLFVAMWEEPTGVFTTVVAREAGRLEEIVRATSLTDEAAWREHYAIDRPSDLLSTLSGREFEAVEYVGSPFDPDLEDRPLTIAFVDDEMIVRGVCTSRGTRVAAEGDTIRGTEQTYEVGAGCDFADVDAWQLELLTATLSLSFEGDRLVVRTSVDGTDVKIELVETTFSGYS